MKEIIIAILALGGICWIIYKNLKRYRSIFHMNIEEPSSPEAVAAEKKAEDEFDMNIQPIDEKTLNLSEINRAFRIAEMHFTRGNFDEAEKFFLKVLSLHPQHTETLNRLGVIYIQRGNSRKAEMLYRKLLSITQKEPSYYCNYGRCLYNQERKREAIEAYENAIKLDCTKANRYISVGQIYYELEEYEKAEEYFEKALQLEPGNMNYLKLHADITELTGNTERAHRSIKRLAENEPYNESLQERLKKSSASETINTPEVETSNNATDEELVTATKSSPIPIPQTEEPSPDSQPQA